MKNSPLIVGLVLAALGTSPVVAQTTWHVAAGACPGPGTGTVGDPFCTIQAGIDAATNGDEVVIADGTYVGAGNRALDFGGRLISVRSASGRAGCILDAQGAERHFVFQTGETSAAVVSELTLRNGAGVDGGAIQLTGASPTFDGCRFESNVATSDGGAVWADATSEPSFSGCDFVGNQAAGVGGACTTDGGEASFSTCLFDTNSAAAGGALHVEGSVSDPAPQISDCSFTDNTATASWGGALSLLGTQSSLIERCAFTGNDANLYGGAVQTLLSLCRPVFSDCTFTGNTAAELGGAVRATSGSDPVYERCAFTWNEAGLVGGALIIQAGSGVIRDCVIENNTSPGRGGGIGFVNGTGGEIPRLENSLIVGNTAPLGAGIDIQGQTSGADADPLITGCTIRDNVASSEGGGIRIRGGAAPVIEHTVIRGNTAAFGGGVAIQGVGGNNNTTPSFDNVVIDHNNATDTGGAIWSDGALHGLLARCTIADNTATETGGVFLTFVSDGGTLEFDDSILWGNSGDQIRFGGGGSEVLVRWSDVQGGFGGPGNIDANPRFINAAAGIYGLLSDSPCIDSGARFSDPDPDGSDTDMGAVPYDEWTRAAFGTLGLSGFPDLSGDGPLTVGNPATITLVDAAPGSIATLVIAPSYLGAPFKGGVFVPDAQFLLIALPVPGNGTIVVSAPWPAGVPSKFTTYLQYWISDPANATGFASSNGLTATTP